MDKVMCITRYLSQQRCLWSVDAIHLRVKALLLFLIVLSTKASLSQSLAQNLIVENGRITDSVSGKIYSNGAVTGTTFSNAAAAETTFSFFNSIVDPVTHTSLNPQSNLLQTGFTVAVELNPAGPSTSVEHVISLADSSYHVFFSLLRDNTGHWEVGKAVDPAQTGGANLSYIIRSWDPVNPCVKTLDFCTSDNVYITFYPEGQIRLDEIVGHHTNGGSTSADLAYDWQAGLLNAGLPITEYPQGLPSQAPSALPVFVMPMIFALWNPEANYFGAPSIYGFNDIGSNGYPQAQLQRVSLYSDGPLIQSGSASIGLTQDLGSGALLTTAMFPCNTQVYQQDDSNTDTGIYTTQYAPSNVLTPCSEAGSATTPIVTPPAAPVLNGPSGDVLPDEPLLLTWLPPRSWGSGKPQGYYLSVNTNYLGTRLRGYTYFLDPTQTSYQLNLQPGTDYKVSIEALNSKDGLAHSNTILFSTASNNDRVQYLEIPSPIGGSFTSEGTGETADSMTLSVIGSNLVNSAGVVTLRGVNLGGWLAQESQVDGEVTPDSASIPNRSADRPCTNSPNGYCLNDRYALERLESRFGVDGADQLITAWEDNFITTADLVAIKSAGFNVVRVPFSWRNLQTEQGAWITNGAGEIDFSRFDWLISQARQAGLYVILDLHVWQGQQANFNNVVNKGSADELEAIALWTVVAAHFKNESTIAGFDILNNVPTSNPSVWPDFYSAIRSVDPTRILFVEHGAYNQMDAGWTGLVFSPHIYGADSSDLATAQSGFNSSLEGAPIPNNGAWPVFVGEMKLEPQTAPWVLAQMTNAGWGWAPWTWKAVNDGGWALVNYMPSPDSALISGSSPYVDLEHDSYDGINAAWSTNLAPNFAAINTPLYNAYTAGAELPASTTSIPAVTGLSVQSATEGSTTLVWSSDSSNDATEVEILFSSLIPLSPSGGVNISSVSYSVVASQIVAPGTTTATFQTGLTPGIFYIASAFHINGEARGPSAEPAPLFLEAAPPLPGKSVGLPTGGPAGTTLCASEGQTCAISVPSIVYYGANTSFYSQTTNTSISCSVTVFGDPLYGINKSCYSLPIQVSGYTLCAPEGSTCVFPGTATILFGIPGNFYTQSATGSVGCNDAVFAGDPAPYQHKACFYKTTAANSAGWMSVTLGGGGFVSGLTVHPAGAIYARTDVGGVYRWQGATKNWLPLTDGSVMQEYGQQGAEAIGLDPNNPNALYLMMGTTTSGGFFSSPDQGDTMTLVSRVPFDVCANGSHRESGPRLAVDPSNGEHFFYGTADAGLWVSWNSGATWSKHTIPATGAPTGPTSTNYNGCYGSWNFTGGGVVFVQALGNGVVYIGITAPSGPNVFVSVDNGETWKPVTGQPNAPLKDGTTASVPIYPVEGVVGPSAASSKGYLYVTYSAGQQLWNAFAGRVYRYDLVAHSWTDITPNTSNWVCKEDAGGSPYVAPVPATCYDYYGYSGIAIDANNPGTLVISSLDRYYDPDSWNGVLENWGFSYSQGRQDTIWRSVNYGASWQPDYDAVYPNSSNNAGISVSQLDSSAEPWMNNFNSNPFGPWPSGLAIDPANSNHLMYGTGRGVFDTYQAAAVGTGSAGSGYPSTAVYPPTIQFEGASTGIEETVVNQLLMAPAGLISLVDDVCGFLSSSLTQSPASILTATGNGYTSAVPYLNSNCSTVDVSKGPTSGNVLARSGVGNITPPLINYNIANYQSTLTPPYALSDSASYSTDGGKTWTLFPAMPQPANPVTPVDGAGSSIAVDYDSNVILLANPNTPPSYTTNRGVSWAPVPGVTELNYDPSDMTNVYSVTGNIKEHNYFQALSTSGLAPLFYLLFTGNTNVSPSVSPDLYVVVGAANGQVSATAHSNPMPGNRPIPYSSTIYSSPNPAASQEVWLGVDGTASSTSSGLFHSTNGGSSFTQIPNVAGVKSIGFGAPPNNSSSWAMYMVGWTTADASSILPHVYASVDNGVTWTRIDQNFSFSPSTVTGDPKIFGKVYLGTTGRGVFVGQVP